MPTLKWLVSAAQWVLANGSKVPDARAKGACEAIIAQAQADMGVLAQQVISGQITKATFEQGMRQAIDRCILGNAALAHGGVDNLTPKILEACAGRAAAQYEYAAQFTREINAGILSTAQISNRAVSYANEGRTTYENEFTRAKSDAGFGYACRILGATDHCPGCLEAAAAGWVPIDELLPIGDADCGARCHCVVVYKQREDSAEAPAVTKQVERAQTKLDAYNQLQAQKKQSLEESSSD